MTTMTFPITFKVHTVKADNKDSALRIITPGFGWTMTSKTNGMVLSRSTRQGSRVFRLYRLQKFNKKSSQVQKKVMRGKNKGKTVSIMTPIRRPHWIVTYIDVPDHLVKSVSQYNRTFSLTLGA